MMGDLEGTGAMDQAWESVPSMGSCTPIRGTPGLGVWHQEVRGPGLSKGAAANCPLSPSLGSLAGLPLHPGAKGAIRGQHRP